MKSIFNSQLYGIIFAYSFIVGFVIVGVQLFIVKRGFIGIFLMLIFLITSFLWFYDLLKDVGGKK
jgi:hypothetical protein